MNSEPGSTMDEVRKMLDKVKINGERPSLFEPHDVLSMLTDAGDDWRIIWEELPTLTIFDALYAKPAKFDAFIYRDAFYERRLTGDLAGSYYWDIFFEEGELFLDWILDHPPFDCCVPVADLFRHAQQLEPECSPWRLFEHVAGYREAEVAATMLGIGGNDAVTLGRALESWGEYADVVDPYIQLINHYYN